MPTDEEPIDATMPSVSTIGVILMPQKENGPCKQPQPVSTAGYTNNAAVLADANVPWSISGRVRPLAHL